MVGRGGLSDLDYVCGDEIILSALRFSFLRIALICLPKERISLTVGLLSTNLMLSGLDPMPS